MRLMSCVLVKQKSQRCSGKRNFTQKPEQTIYYDFHIDQTIFELHFLENINPVNIDSRILFHIQTETKPRKTQKTVAK